MPTQCVEFGRIRCMSISDAYRNVVLEHNRAPRRRGRLAAPTHQALGVNALCGDQLRLELTIADGYLRDFAFEAEVSALTLAATSIMGDLLIGLSVEDARQLAEAALNLVTCNPQRVSDPRLGDFNLFLGVLGYPNRIKTVTLPWATLLGVLDGRPQTSTDIDIRGAHAARPRTSGVDHE